jgi:diguanylate cyclase (GGDEF)-like protein
MGPASSPEANVFLSTMPAGPDQRRLAITVLVFAAALFLAGLPFARIQLPAVWAFIPVYESWLVIIDGITAVLLFGQYAILRSRALLVLGAGYLFTASMTVAHALSFPGLFAENGLLGAGPQTTAWLYSFWRTGYAVSILLYALLKDREPEPYPPRRRARVGVLWCAGLVLLATVFFTWLATAGVPFLPVLMDGHHYAPGSYQVALIGWPIGIVAIVVLWRKKPHSVLDLWVLVVACIQALDVALSSTLNSGRFDLGWYVGRMYGVIAVSVVLLILLIENNRLYAKLVDGQAELRRLTVVDPLTNIANRRAFDEAIDEEWRRAMRNRTPLALLLIDVDSFKAFNDLYGHVAGDRCLRLIADVLAGGVRRAGETVARYGGEEFAILLPATDLEKASALAGRLLQAVRELDIPRPRGESACDITISIGVACVMPVRAADATDQGATVLVEAADKALYAAKKAGRNRVSEYVPYLAELQPMAKAAD